MHFLGIMQFVIDVETENHHLVSFSLFFGVSTLYKVGFTTVVTYCSSFMQKRYFSFKITEKVKRYGRTDMVTSIESCLCD